MAADIETWAKCVTPFLKFFEDPFQEFHITPELEALILSQDVALFQGWVNQQIDDLGTLVQARFFTHFPDGVGRAPAMRAALAELAAAEARLGRWGRPLLSHVAGPRLDTLLAGVFGELVAGAPAAGLAGLAGQEALLSELLYAAIEARVAECAGGAGRLAELLAWADGLAPLLAAVGAPHWGPRLRYHLYECFGALRARELFDLAKALPEPAAAAGLDDLAACLAQTRLRAGVARSLAAQLQRRLLHEGADTALIITQYSSIVRALARLDPGGSLLAEVAPPLRAYLKRRPDTVRCIVTALSEGDEELGEHGMLISIYGSAELFAGEYQGMLANRLLASTTFESERDIRAVELLKLRFGEAALQSCEIMLRDLADSRRFAQQRPGPLAATILSHLFWPQLRQEPFRLPPAVAEQMDAYRAAYEAHKASRTLAWRPSLGLVHLALNFQDGRTFDQEVTPLQATLITHFEEQSIWRLDDLADAMDMDEATTRRKLIFWINNRVLKESSKDIFEVIEILADEEEVVFVEEDDAGIASNQQADVLDEASKFIPGILTTFSALPLDRLQNMLTNHVAGYTATSQDLKRLLDKMVLEDRIEFNGIEYTMKRR